MENHSQHSTVTVDGFDNVKSALLQGAATAASSSRRYKKSVRFNEACYARAIPTLASYSLKEITSIWYTDDEMHQMKKDSRDTIRQYRKSLSVTSGDDDDNEATGEVVYIRGLECRVSENAKKRLAVKRAAWDAVMNEQEQQWDSFRTDSEAISRAYRPISEEAQRKAFLVGRMDRRAASLANRDD